MEDETTTGELAEMRRELGEIKTILKEIRSAVITDHHKIEELEASKKNLEMTGRISAPPVGL